MTQLNFSCKHNGANGNVSHFMDTLIIIVTYFKLIVFLKRVPHQSYSIIITTRYNYVICTDKNNTE